VKVKELGETHQSSVKSVASLLMKLPKIADGFEELRTVFAKYANNDQPPSLSVDKLKGVSDEMGNTIPDALWNQVVQEVDLDKSMTITFSEFVVFKTLIYLFDPFSDLNNKGNFGTSVSIVVDAFMFFDLNKDGLLVKEEVLDTVGNEPKEGSSAAVASALFKDMDWDANGSITFVEFLFACEKWTGILDKNEET